MKKLIMVVLAFALVLFLSVAMIGAAPNGKPNPVRGAKDVQLVVFLHYASGSVSPVDGGTEDNPTYKTHADAKWLSLPIYWSFNETDAPLMVHLAISQQPLTRGIMLPLKVFLPVKELQATSQGREIAQIASAFFLGMGLEESLGAPGCGGI